MVLFLSVVPLCRYAMAKWIRAKPYVTVADIAAKLRDHPAIKQMQLQQNVQALTQIAQALAVAAAR